LNAEGKEGDDNEHPVVEELGEHVPLVLAKLTRVNLVEKLEEDEGLEDDRVHVHLVGWLVLFPLFCI